MLFSQNETAVKPNLCVSEMQAAEVPVIGIKQVVEL